MKYVKNTRLKATNQRKANQTQTHNHKTITTKTVSKYINLHLWIHDCIYIVHQFRITDDVCVYVSLCAVTTIARQTKSSSYAE